MSEANVKRIGRPPRKDRSKVKLCRVAMAITPQLHGLLKEAMLMTGRSMAGEMTVRLERSFRNRLIDAERRRAGK